MQKEAIKKDIRKVAIVLVLLAITLIISKITSKFYADKEAKIRINFVINRIEISQADRCYLYDKSNKELELKSYTFFNISEVKVGDSLFKEENSRIMWIYRKDNYGKYKVISKKLN